MLALAVYRAGLCPHCGRPMRVCTAAEAENAYVVSAPTRCHATTALLIAAKAAPDSPHPEALLYHAERR